MPRRRLERPLITTQENAVVVLEMPCDLRSGWSQQAAMYAMASRIAEMLATAGFDCAIDPVLGHRQYAIRLELCRDDDIAQAKRLLETAAGMTDDVQELYEWAVANGLES